ncbi:MAG: two-component system, OmpR family, sensor histidine kinase KdpD [Solirubrobacteraceae bacterium]|nr:two-component system, OmpR family, sensor histidine kinase KdpD [Solirubrobacteraceae bacterium]
MRARPLPLLLLRPTPPPVTLGLGVAAGLIALETLAGYPLSSIAPEVSLGVVYLLGVLIVSTVWGFALGVATSIASALAFNFFHIPPAGRLWIADAQNWVALAVFLVVALVASSVAELARARALEALERRREADLAAEMARLLLRTDDLRGALPAASQRLAHALDLPSAAIELEAVPGDERRVAFPLRDGATPLGTLLVPADLSEPALRRLQERVVPSLEALLGAARERDALLAEVVETAALRRSDVVKTALLRAVSHDLRSPLTAIVTAADTIGSPTVSDADRDELAHVITSESRRLARLVDQLLDLSRLAAGAAEPRRDWVALDEVLRSAIENLDRPPQDFALAIDRDLPLIRADAAQLERALANVLDNAARHSGGHPVSVRTRAVGGRLLVRVVDRGPGVPAAQRERIFEPFYRAGTERSGHRGSGLGLAIARGLITVNGGRIWVESLPGQGTTFAMEFPLEPAGARTAAPVHEAAR